MSATLVLTGVVLCMVSGFPALAGRRGQMYGAALMVAASIAGLAGCFPVLLGASSSEVSLRWAIPNAAIDIRIDALSAFFAAPVFLLAGAGAVYAVRYWPPERRGFRSVRIFFGFMAGALALVMTVGNTILFIAAWEVVTLSAFVLVGTEHEELDTRRAAWIYIAASHVATLALFAIVAILHSLTRTWAFSALPVGTAALPAGRAIFCLSLLAFGTKSGIMPFHIWLPGAHAAAPSHVSAMMSGVVIKMGIYGLIRVLSLFDALPVAFGVTLLVAGIVSSIFGVAFALTQHDLKRLLAYHSIENIGIIVTGLGIGLLAQTYGQPALSLLGFAGALLHVWNHSLFKSLLFFSAGGAIHEVHTREIDQMGGLARTMPWTAAAFLIGAVAITGLPPLNGFVSEWLLYVAGVTSIAPSVHRSPLLLVVLVAPALALTGALALACFVKAFGATFLGSPRSAPAAGVTEVPWSMRAATVPLVLACAAIGLAPAAVAPMLLRAVALASRKVTQTGDLAPLLIPVQTTAIVVAIVMIAATATLLITTRRASRTMTWDCGYAEPSARMQYTSSSFARGLAGFFAWAMPAVVHAPGRFTLFPSRAAFESHVPDTILDRALLPAVRGVQWSFGLARFVQSGRIQIYLLYIGVTLVVLLTWSAQ